MARTNTERITFYQTQIDAIDDALAASSGAADVVTYRTTDGVEVTRNRTAARQEIEQLEKQINRLQQRTSGPAYNLIKRVR